MKKALVLVCNSFTNDKRVMNISSSLYNMNYQVFVLAAKQYKNIPTKEHKNYSIYRIPLFSSLYARSAKVKKLNVSKSNNRKLYNGIKNNTIRISITAFLNWFCFNLGAFIKGLSCSPDLVYANDLDTLMVGYLIAKIKKAKIIYDSHEIWLQSSRFENASWIHKKIWVIIEAKLIHKVNSVIVTTQARADYLEKYYNIKEVNVLKNCPRFQNIKKTLLLREEFKIPKENTILLYQGMLTEKRGIFRILNVIESVDNISIIFMGMGQDKEKLISCIEERNLTNKVFVKDAVAPDVLLQYTASADIGLQLLYNSNFNHYSTISNKIFEYIMAGIAIIASDFPEIRKIITENQIGLLIDPENEEQIKDAILKFVNDKAFLTYCKSNSLSIRHRYTWENEELKLIKILDNIK